MKRRPHEIHIDRAGRGQLVVVLEQWLEGDIDAGLVVKSLKKIHAEQSKLPLRLPWGVRAKRVSDKYFREILKGLIEYFESVNRKSRYEPDRDSWNYFQRVMLLLSSDASLMKRTQRRWSWSSLVAVIGLAGYGALWINLGGLGGGWLLYTAPFGLIAFPLWWWRTKQEIHWSPETTGDERRVPFDSYAQLMQVRRRVKNFRKRPFVGRGQVNNQVGHGISLKTARKYWAYVSMIFHLIWHYYLLLMLFTLFSPLMLLLAIPPLSKDMYQLMWRDSQA